jgi:quercetin dioxygenase-like cupin family protein
VLKGKAELHIEHEVIELSEGDSYLVPKGAEHTYKILETFSAVEATSPPAHLQ